MALPFNHTPECCTTHSPFARTGKLRWNLPFRPVSPHSHGQSSGHRPYSKHRRRSRCQPEPYTATPTPASRCPCAPVPCPVCVSRTAAADGRRKAPKTRVKWTPGSPPRMCARRQPGAAGADGGGVHALSSLRGCAHRTRWPCGVSTAAGSFFPPASMHVTDRVWCRCSPGSCLDNVSVPVARPFLRTGESTLHVRPIAT